MSESLRHLCDHPCVHCVHCVTFLPLYVFHCAKIDSVQTQLTQGKKRIAGARLKGLATLDAFASRHGMDPFRQFVKLSVNEWSRPYWMRYGYITVNALRHVTDTSISAKSMCVENRIDASSSSVFCIFLPRTLKSR